ncbi:hypothetical protein D6C83_06402 [Aureobasidium pullulans]|uniref:RNase H type-1 domain-containing protein n=1 Tax=Aureobasidium pullulans TaxID=5580 RepID=A0A4T0BWC0_AURPU|nr:hypothetical protein D6C83_06402 [Aureobasidium pullulans]TIA51198.1 hypothetical protein D6C79_02677 [Aureobasidium pullulans]
MGFPDTPVESANGKLVCQDHGLQICHQCCCDYTFIDDSSEQVSSDEEVPSSSSGEDRKSEVLSRAEPATQVLTGAAAKFIPSGQSSQYCEECSLTWMSVFPADVPMVFDELCPTHDSLPGTRADQRTIFVNIDGACPGNGTTHAVGGLGVSFGPSSIYNISELIHRNPRKPPTSQQAELKAAIRALEVIREKYLPNRRVTLSSAMNTCPCHEECWARGLPFRIVLVTDSAYLFDCMTSHLFIWRWDPKNRLYSNKKSGKVIMNSKHIRGVVEEIEKLAGSGVQVLWRKVPRELNEEADRLAKAGTKIEVKKTGDSGYLDEQGGISDGALALGMLSLGLDPPI